MTTNAVQEIKSRISLSDIASQHIDLKPSSKSLVGVCPFHDDSKASFHVYFDGHFHCYGCKASGDIFDFVARINGWDFKTVLKHLAEKAGVDLSLQSGNRAPSGRTSQLRHVLDVSQSYFAGTIETVCNTAAGDYIQQRGLSQATMERFSIGFAPDSWDGLRKKLETENILLEDAVDLGVLGQAESGRVYDLFRGRLIFPIHDISGRIVGFGGRAISDDQEPKYINSKDSLLFKKGNLLYGLSRASKAIQKAKSINLVEGYIDVLSLVDNGYKNSAGYLGTAFTPEHAAQVARLTTTAYLIPDADTAGRKAAILACKLLLQEGIECWVVVLPDGEDVDSLLSQPEGKNIFDEAQRGAIHGFSYLTNWVNNLSLKDKSRWVSDFLNGTVREFHGWIIPRLSALLQVSQLELRRMIKDAPDMYDEEQKVLQFLHSFPAYVQTLQARGVEDLFLSKEAVQQWEILLSGEGIEMPKLELQGAEILSYWYNEIKTILPHEKSA